MQTQKENVFDEGGQTVAQLASQDTEAPEQTDIVEETAEEVVEEAAVEAAPAPESYRIGDKNFTSQADALAYAQQLDAERQSLDAYQQGLRDAMSQTPGTAENVTPAAPAAPEINPEELYTNPQAYMEKYGNKIKAETQAALEARMQAQATSEQIWREFTDRHPELADFRAEVESCVEENKNDVLALIRTKGRPAGYDHVALKLKSRFESYSNALKPKRQLSNSVSVAPPAARATGVTPKAPQEKVLSFAEQVRSIRKRR